MLNVAYKHNKDDNKQGKEEGYTNLHTHPDACILVTVICGTCKLNPNANPTMGEFVRRCELL